MASIAISAFDWDGTPRSQSQLSTGMEALDRNPAFEWDGAPQGLMATLAIPKQTLALLSELRLA